MSNSGEWLTLSQASTRLGIAASTLRRWADDGRLVSMTTLGGHRRFPSAAIESMLPSARARRPALRGAGASPKHIARAYRDASIPASGWLDRLSEAERQRFRERGRMLVDLIIAYLDAADPAQAKRRRTKAEAAVTEYAARARSLRISLADTIDGFLVFRRPLLSEIAAAAPRRSLDSREAANFVLQAESVLDDLLLALIRAYSSA